LGGADAWKACCMLKAIMLQLSLVLVMVGIALFVGGWMAGLSALLGGLSYAVPSLLFAIRLGRLARPGAQAAVSYPLEFFLGEAIKVVSTIGLLLLCHYLVPGLSWGWFLGGLGAALQAGFFAFLFKH
jgi:ATP synthase protein I